MLYSMSDGWIKIHRSILEDELYFSEKFTRTQAWIDLLLLAEYKPKVLFVRGIRLDLQRGQLAISIRDLSARWKWGVNKVQSFIKELVESGKIDTQKSNLINVISICKYEIYQGVDDAKTIQVDTQMNTQTDTQTNTQTDTQAKEKVTKKKFIEESKEIILGDARANAPAPQPKKSKEEILQDTEKRRSKFYNSLIPYVKIYGKEMVRAFYDYWSELNKSATKMRWEQQQTWELERRLATWERKDSQYNKQGNGNSRTVNSTAEQRTIEAASTIAAFIADDDD